MNDTELERLAARLGQRAAGDLDPEKIAERVIARLDEPPVIAIHRVPMIRRAAGLALAAMLLIALGLAFRPSSRPVDQSAMTGTVLQELDGLGADELEQLLQTMPVTSSTVPDETVPLQELDTLSLKRLLRALEG